MTMYRVYGTVYEAATPEEAFAKARAAGAQAPDSLAPPRAQGFAPPVPPKQKYRIYGEIFEAEDPEGAFAQYAQQQKIKEVESQPFYQKMWHGASNPIEEAYYGGKQLLQGGLDQEDTAYVQQLRDELEGAGGWGMAGEAATWLVPGGAAGKLGTKALQLGGRALGKSLAGRAAGQALGGAGLEGAYQASRARLEGDASRGERAALGAGLGAAGGAVGELLPSALSATMRKLGKPMRTSAASEQLVKEAKDMGVKLQPTVGQSVDDSTFLGRMTRGFEQTAANNPLGAVLLGEQSKAVADWNVSAMRKALPADLREVVTESGSAGFTAAKAAIGKAYDDALSPLKGRFIGDVDAVQEGLIDGLGLLEANTLPRITQELRAPVLTAVDNLLTDLGEGRITASNIKEVESKLREMSFNAGKNGNIDQAEAYDEMLQLVRKARDSTVGEESAERLAELDASYKKLMPMVKAGGMVGAISEQAFTPAQMRSAALRGQSDWTKAQSKMPGVAEGLLAEKAFGNVMPKPGPGTAEKMLITGTIGGLGGLAYGGLTGEGVDMDGITAGASLGLLPFGMKAGRIGLLGRTRPQRALLKAAGAAGRGTAKGIPLARATYIANQRNRERKQ